MSPFLLVLSVPFFVLAVPALFLASTVRLYSFVVKGSAASIVIAGITYLATMWDSQVSFLLILLCMITLLPSLITSLLGLFSGRYNLARFSVSLAGFMILATFLSSAFDMHETEAVKLYCEKFVSPLEDYQISHGSYPHGLGEVSASQFSKPLRVLVNGDNKGCGYQTTSDGRFVFLIKAGGLSYWAYRVRDQRWEFYD